MRTNKKKQALTGVVQLLLFSAEEMRAMEERDVKFLPIKDILWELDMLPGLKGQCFRDSRTVLLNRKLSDRLKVAPVPIRVGSVRRGIRIIDS